MWFSLRVGAKTVECKPSAFCSLATSTGCGHGSQRDQGWAPGSATSNTEMRAKSLTPGLLKCRMGLSAPPGEPCGDKEAKLEAQLEQIGQPPTPTSARGRRQQGGGIRLCLSLEISLFSCPTPRLPLSQTSKVWD